MWAEGCTSVVCADNEIKRNLETIRKINGEEDTTLQSGCRGSHPMEHSANSEGTEIGGNEVLVSRKKIKTSAAGFVQQKETCNFSLRGRGGKTPETHWL